MERRQKKRLQHRIKLRFWIKGEEASARTGYTRDVSTLGLFIRTKSPFPPGTRLVLETVDSPGYLKAEAEVVHYLGKLEAVPGSDGGTDSDFVAAAPKLDREKRADAISPILHRVMPSGMGVRFLQPVPNIELVLGIEGTVPQV